MIASRTSTIPGVSERETIPAAIPRLSLAALAGFVVGVLGGLIGLGGAEFRIPLLIGICSFPALAAVILNKATSLIVVAFGLLARSAAVPVTAVAAEWPVMLTLLTGSLVGAWIGADWATRRVRGFIELSRSCWLGLPSCYWPLTTPGTLRCPSIRWLAPPLASQPASSSGSSRHFSALQVESC